MKEDKDKKHKSLIHRNHYIRYSIFPGVSENLVPNETNFSIDRFAPDLSKTYSLSNTLMNNMNDHLKQRKGCTRLVDVKTKGRNQNMLIIWMMMWLLSKEEINNQFIAFEYLEDKEK